MANLKNEIAGTILHINAEISRLREQKAISDKEESIEIEEKIIHLEKSKEGLREAKFYVGLAEN